MKNWKFFLLAVSCVSCGYRWEPDYPNEIRPSISVPFVQGDEDGTLTAEIVHKLAASGLADVTSKSGDYQLRVSIVNTTLEQVGYRIDPQKIKGEIKKNLLATEGRKTITMEAALYDKEEVAFGPYKIVADIDYDYVDGDSLQDLTFTNSAGEFLTVLPFSLGQLESVESAQEAALRPLNVRLAQKVVDAIFSEW